MDRIGLAAVGQLLAGEDDVIAGEIGLQGMLRTVAAPITNLGRDARKGVLAKCLPDRVDVLPFAQPQLTAKVAETSQLDDSRDGAASFFNPPVDDERVELVSQWAGLAVVFAVIHFPLDGKLAVLVLLRDVDDNVAVLRQPVNRKAGEGGFHPDGVGRRKLGVDRDGQFHKNTFKKAPPPDLLVLFFVGISLSV